MSREMSESGLLLNADSASVDGLTAEIATAVRTAERYDSPAFESVHGEALRKKRDRAVQARRRQRDSQVLVPLTRDGLLAAGMGADQELRPHAGLTVVQATRPKIEYAVIEVPTANGWLTTIDSVILEILGLGHVFGSSDPWQGAQLLGPVLEGKVGNRSCDWNRHSWSNEQAFTALDMRVLLSAQGNRLYAWVCCPACFERLNREFPAGLAWLPGQLS